MHCTLPRTQSDITGISDRRKASLPLKTLEQHNITTPEDCIESQVIWQHIPNRCRIVTFLTLSDGNWNILTVPVQSPDNTNLPTSHSQYVGRSSSGSQIRSRPRSKAIQNSNLLPDNKTDRTIGTNSNKKVRKKGKYGRKFPSDGGLADISPLPSHQLDLQGSIDGDRDTLEAISSLSDHNVPEKFSVSRTENPLRTNDLPFSESPSSNGSSELDVVLVSSDSGDREVEIRHKELLNSNPGEKVLNNVIDLAGQREETRRGNKRNASKRSYRVKTAVNNPSTSRSGTLGNSHCHNNTGKENSHPVWQKVQKKLGRERGSAKVNDKIVEINEAPRHEDKKQVPSKVSGKLKRKHNPGSKQESNRHSRKGSLASNVKRGSSNRSALSNSTSVSGVLSPCGSPRDKSRISDAESLNPEPVHDSLICCDGLQQFNGGNINSNANSDSGCMGEVNSSLGESRVDPNIVSPAMCLPHLLANRVVRSDKEDAILEFSGQKSTSGSATQKWVPIGAKSLSSTGSTSKSYISVGHPHALACQEQTSEVDSESTVPLSTPRVEIDFTPHEVEAQSEPIENHNCHTPEDQNHIVASDSSIFRKFKDQSQTDLDRIATAVDHSHMAQLESEAIQTATGGPIAEFETLLHLSSPVLCLSRSISSCKMCWKNDSSSSLCIHERPDIPLGCFWEWYKEHGMFGLEIPAKDYNNSKRLGIDRFSFRAYFVPYLSAVQLFRTDRSQMGKREVGDPDTHEARENSTVGHLPIYPLLVPQASKDEIATRAVDGADFRESDLIFEYFELEPPQQRRPLYEKIQELLRGEGRDKPYGDPSVLDSNLGDLDPRSWYAVAWYPIYRIPDGNFRAAFLTYHSFGHLVRRNGIEDRVVSPVVGLQSYNAQGECWLQLRPSIMSQTRQSLDASKILTERLRTLEEAASLMSRATVSKGNLTSVNKHSDYEFFLSRRQYY